MDKDDFGALFVVIMMVSLIFMAGAYYGKFPASDYWKAEIVRHGYGTWEATPDGQIWFKWKANNMQP